MISGSGGVRAVEVERPRKGKDGVGVHGLAYGRYLHSDRYSVGRKEGLWSFGQTTAVTELP